MKFLSVLLLVALSACQQSNTKATEDRSQTFEGLTLSRSENGKPAWNLHSKHAKLNENEKIAYLENPDMDFYRDMKVVSRVTALKGQILTESHDVVLSSSVVLDTYEDRSQLTTNELAYSSEISRFHTKSPVVVKRPNSLITGQGLVATSDLSEIRIFEQKSVLHGKTSR